MLILIVFAQAINNKMDNIYNNVFNAGKKHKKVLTFFIDDIILLSIFIYINIYIN